MANDHEPRQIVGLVPAAGSAKRIAPLPCSKEIYPVGFGKDAAGEIRPRVACHHLFDKFRLAGARTAYVVIKNGKWDIPAYLADGALVGIDLAYIVVPGTLGPPDTLDRAFPFVADKVVAFGFPDIIFGPDDALVRLLERLHDRSADIVLGLLPAHDVTQMDMVGVDEAGRVHTLLLKPPATELRYSWVCAVWTPVFTAFMRAFVGGERGRDASRASEYRRMDLQGDLPVGAVIRAAMENGLAVYGVEFPDDRYIDIGTPGDLRTAVQTMVTRGAT